MEVRELPGAVYQGLRARSEQHEGEMPRESAETPPLSPPVP